MSNAMRNGKRGLAAVAAGALGLALVPFVGTTAASADTATATVSPVRYTDSVTVPDARASFDLTMSGTTSVALTVAPTGGTLKVSGDDTIAALGAPGVNVVVNNGGADDSYIELRATKAGRYAGSIYDGTDTAAFDFTTVGSPTSMTLTPASQTVLEGATATLTVTLKDASGNVTQPSTVDSVAMTQSADDTLSTASVTAANLYAGEYDVELDTTGNAAGTTTVTATPLGTLPGDGIAAQTATVTKSGTVSSTDAVSVSVTTPSNAVSKPANTDDTVDRAVAVPTGTAAVVITIDDTTGNPVGQQLRFKLTPNDGAVTVAGESGSSSAALFVDVTTDANRQATISATLSGAALLATNTLTVKQVKVDNSNVSSGAGVVVTQTNRSVTAASITVSPDDSVVGTLGTAIPVSVTVTDQFGDAQAGWTIGSYRGTAVSGGTFLNQAVTDTNGQASVTVVNATGAVAGAVEQYSINATPSVGSAVPVDNALQVTWTADGGITSLSVAVSGTSVTTPITDTTTSVTTAPVVGVPADGSASSQSGGSFTVATGAVVAAADGDMTVYTPTASPLNNVTVSVPTGLYVSTTATTAWDAGESSVTVSSGTAVYVFGLTVGTYDVTFTSGGKTVTAPVEITTSAVNAYNMALTPDDQSVGAGAITTVTLAVTDVFGNPVTTAEDTGAVTITAGGAVLLAGFQTSASYTTGADGTATVTVIGGNSAGTGTLAAGPKSSDAAAAWQTGYTPPTNAPAPVTSAAAIVRVSGTPTTQAITIVGERGTVRGKPGIIVDGVTEGFGQGAIVRPWVKFPGQTSYTLGTKEILVDQDGEFMWQRRTGKKIYIIIKSEDESVRSNRIIIPAK